MKRNWSKEEDSILISLDGKSVEEMHCKLPWRTESSIRNRFKVLRVNGLIEIGIRKKCICRKCGETFYHAKNATSCGKCNQIKCEICGKEVKGVSGKRVEIAKYCSKECAYIGQPKNREPWAKGKTKNDDPRLMSISNHTKKQMETQGKGKEHPMFGKKHKEESLEKMSKNNNYRKLKEEGKEIPSDWLMGLDLGRKWFKGKTKDNCKVVASRAKKLSELYKGKPNFEHSKRMKEYYEKYPEKHPNRILASKKSRTYIEQIMYDKLKENGIDFEEQYRILRYYGDFAIPQHKLIIECDGEYWHDPQRDKVRDNKINEEGWNVIRFTGRELVKDPEKCIKEVLRRLS